MTRVLAYGDDVHVTDEELTAEAMAADPESPVADDAVPFGVNESPEAILPDWYMPAPGGGRGKGRRIVLTVLAGSLVVGNLTGFCVTFGFPEFVWH